MAAQRRLGVQISFPKPTETEYEDAKMPRKPTTKPARSLGVELFERFSRSSLLAQEPATTASPQVPHGADMPVGSKCPITGAIRTLTSLTSTTAEESKTMAQGNTLAGAYTNGDWWPNQLNLKILHQNSPAGNPMGEKFNYAEEFNKLD